MTPSTPRRGLTIRSAAIPQVNGAPLLEPLKLEGEEGVNTLFEYRLALQSPEGGAHSLELNAFIGRELTCWLLGVAIWKRQKLLSGRISHSCANFSNALMFKAMEKQVTCLVWNSTSLQKESDASSSQTPPRKSNSPEPCKSCTMAPSSAAKMRRTHCLQASLQAPPLVHHFIDPARGQRYSVLGDALWLNPDLRFPNLDKVLPLPPAPLPQWDGKPKSLINAAKGVRLAPQPLTTSAHQLPPRRVSFPR